MELYESIDSKLQSWVEAQHIFFVATAPLSRRGHINLSPKGLDTFRILSPQKVAYLDLSGSGIETVAHLKENGRITFMFCSFSAKPRILRFYGEGKSYEPFTDEFKCLVRLFPELPGIRSVITADISRIADSCGYAVPKFEFVEPRETLTKSALRRGEQKLAHNRKAANAKSIDGLDGLSFEPPKSD